MSNILFDIGIALVAPGCSAVRGIKSVHQSSIINPYLLLYSEDEDPLHFISLYSPCTFLVARDHVTYYVI